MARFPSMTYPRGVLAAALGHLGRLDEAREAFASLPPFTEDVMRRVLASSEADFADRVIAGLRLAGLIAEDGD